MKNTIPSNFKKICENLQSVNALTKYYKTYPKVIIKWLNDCEIIIKKTNAAKESIIDIEQFKKDISSGDFTIFEIAKKYQLTNRNVYNICQRNNINKNFKSTRFEPNNKEEFLLYLQNNGKNKTSKKYGITMAVISGWCRRNDIVLSKYLGLRNINVDDKVNDIKKLYKSGYTQTFIGKLYNTSGAKIKRLLTENGIVIKTKFDIWKDERKIILDNIDSYIQSNKNGSNLIEIAKNNNISYEVLKNAFKVRGVDVVLYSSNKSTGELEVKDFINSLGTLCRSVHKINDGYQYEIDCFVEDKNFGVEYCGEYWHSINSGKHKKYHQNKMLWCLNQGIHLMTIFEHEWYTKQVLLKSMIKSRLGIEQNKIYARNTECCIINKAQAKIFHDQNHINGGLTTSSIDFGLFHNNELISVASFSKSRFSKDAEYEILRFSTLQNYRVVGGFSKLFKNFIEMIQPKTVVSFCDLRFGQGNVYKKANFKLIGITPPNYWYYFKKDEKYGFFESRIKYQKHKLKHFSNYSDKKTEYEIMSENGYLRIFDCGNYKFLYENRDS